MTPREYMLERRSSLRMSRENMARKLKISPKLLAMLEEDDHCVTHPLIVKLIAKAYNLTAEQRTMMLPENHRPGPDYDPDRYKFPVDKFTY